MTQATDESLLTKPSLLHMFFRCRWVREEYGIQADEGDIWGPVL